MIKSIINYFTSLNGAGQALFIVGVLLVITFIILLIVVLKPEKNKPKKIYGESVVTDKENDFEEKMKDIDNISINDINIDNDKTRNLKNIVDELKNVEPKNEYNYMEQIEKYEDEQEDTAVISVEELLKTRSTYEPRKQVIKEKKEKVEDLFFDDEPINNTNKVEIKTEPKRNEEIEKKVYKPSREVFSSIYVNDESSKEKPKDNSNNEEFLNNLKEFRNNL